jgi:hypothetical protein
MTKFGFPLFAMAAAFATAGHAGTISTLTGPDISLAVFDSLGNTTTCTTACSLGSASINVLSDPAVLLRAQTFAGGGFSGSYTYYLQVTGGNDGDVVPIHVAGALAAFATGDGLDGFIDTAGADLEFLGIRILLGVDDINGSSLRICQAVCTDSTATGWAGTVNTTGLSGTVFGITLSLSGSAQDGFASASADPHVYIDPVFLAANPGYGLIFSPGVGNELAGSQAPEPSTFVLIGFGIYLVVCGRIQAARVARRGVRG